MMQKVRQMCVENGMPEDRVDNTIAIWVKSANLEAASKTTAGRLPDARGCHDKGDDGVWCPQGDDWYCVKNCENNKHQEVKQDAKECHDKGEYGVWCPKGDDWYCVKNCKDKKSQKIKPDAKGCHDKAEHGLWCPKGDEWYCVKNCKKNK